MTVNGSLESKEERRAGVFLFNTLRVSVLMIKDDAMMHAEMAGVVC